jgi:[acyl-carrier-protein] S-malonyltransferase
VGGPGSAPSTALLFPGQGSQTRDMRSIAEQGWPELLEMVSEHVGCDPFERQDEGTRYSQPAIFCASLAAWHTSDIEGVGAVAGHSLGELGALVAAGCLSPEDGAFLVAERGRLMQAAADTSSTGMLALLGGDEAAVQRLAHSHDATVANDNAPGQVVVAGAQTSLESLARAAREQGLRAIRLGVSGGFHSPAMSPAVGPFRAALASVRLRRPDLPVLSGVTADVFDDIRMRLVQALVKPVLWRQLLIALHARGIASFVEVGPGKVLTGLVRRTLPDVSAHAMAIAAAASA